MVYCPFHQVEVLDEGLRIRVCVFCYSSKLLSQNRRPGRICKSKFIGVCSAVLAMLNGLSNLL